MNQIRKNKMIVKDNNGNFIKEIDIVGLPLASTVANLADVTDAEVQVLLDTILTDDVNGICCNSPLPIISTITGVGNYSAGTVTFTVAITNSDTDIYTIVVKENGVELLNYTGNTIPQTITGLTFVPRRKRIFDVTVTSTTCSGTVDKEQTFALGPEGFTYNMANSLRSGTTNVGQLAKNGTVGGQLIAQVGDSIQIQYFTTAWFNETKTATSVTGSGISISFFNSPFIGVPLSNFIGVPTFGRFRNLTTGGDWQDFGSSIPAVYP